MVGTMNLNSVTSQRLSMTLLTLANLLMPVAVLVFATGFFPYKLFVPGKATFQDATDGGQLESAPFDKVIFMVVDALRRLTSVLHRRVSSLMKFLVTSSTLTSRALNLLKRELSIFFNSLEGD